MKVANIALFKRFLTENGVNTMFKGLYSQYRFEENPENVEDYLKKVDSSDVILLAFKFPKTMKNYKYGEDFWTEMAVKWESLVAKMTTENYYTTYHKAVERYHKEAAIPLDRFNKGLRDVVKKTWEGRSDKPKQQPEPAQRPTVIDEETAAVTHFEAVPHPKPQASGLKGIGTFKYFDLNQTRTSPKMKEDEFSVSAKKGSYKLTFNKVISEMITNAGLTRFRIGADEITGEVRILFGNFDEDDSYAFTVSKSTNLTIANKSLVGILMHVFELKDTLQTLYLSKNLANSKDFIVFRITKTRQ